MTPPNISFRQKSKARFVIPTLVVVVAVAAALILIGSRGGSGKKKQAERTPQVAFAVDAVQVYSEGKNIAEAASAPERDAITKLLTDYYESAFVDPKQWSDPQFSSLKTSFSPETQATFTRDLTSLTIGEGRTEFKRVDPSDASIRLSLYYDKYGHVQFAVAAVHFAARATTNNKRPVNVVQNATYRLQKMGSSWKIFSYEAKSSQDTPTPSPTPSTSPS